MLNLMKNLAVIFIGFAVGFIFYSYLKKENSSSNLQQQAYTRAQQVKKEILKYKKPARIEILTFTKRFQQDIEDIKKLKVPMDENSNFFMEVELFSDDTDETSPLILQIKFKDIRTLALLREDSINLE